LIELQGGFLAGNSSCTLVVAVTGSVAGTYTNTIIQGALQNDPNITNLAPATAILFITAPGGGGGGGGNNNRGRPAGPTSSFLIPVTGFAPGMVTKLEAYPVYDATGLSIEIPVLKVNSAIVGVEKMKGKWDVSWLQNQVGWLNGSAYPTWRGNSLLTGHVVGADGNPGVFSKLKALGVGEYIFVNNSGYRYTYKVISNALVRPYDKRVMKHEEKSYLTLITCDSYNEKTGTYLRRVVVRALLDL
jgi:LPXTG-site transpeptidase (sortase) family protein